MNIINKVLVVTLVVNALNAVPSQTPALDIKKVVPSATPAATPAITRSSSLLSSSSSSSSSSSITVQSTGIKAKLGAAYAAVTGTIGASYSYTKEKTGNAVTWVFGHKMATVGTIAAVSAIAYLVHTYKKNKKQAQQVACFKDACVDYVNFKTGPAIDPQVVIDNARLFIAKNVAVSAEPFVKDTQAQEAVEVIMNTYEATPEAIAQVDEAAAYLVSNVSIAPAA